MTGGKMETVVEKSYLDFPRMKRMLTVNSRSFWVDLRCVVHRCMGFDMDGDAYIAGLPALFSNAVLVNNGLFIAVTVPYHHRVTTFILDRKVSNHCDHGEDFILQELSSVYAHLGGIYGLIALRY